MKGAAFFLLLGLALGPAMPTFAQAPEPSSSASEEPGSVVVFPKFIKGMVTVDGVTRPQTEIKIQVGCPKSSVGQVRYLDQSHRPLSIQVSTEPSA